MTNLMVIDDEVLEAEEIRLTDKGCIIKIGQRSFHVYQNREDAGEEAYIYYKSMAKHFPEEFIYIVGEQALIYWCLGHYHSGYSSLEEYFDYYANHPEEHFATKNGEELDIRINRNLMFALGFGCTSCVAYQI